MGIRFLIWSWEKRAWWRPAAQGYTTDIKQAGEFSFEQAAKYTVGHYPPGEEVSVAFHEGLLNQPDYRPPVYGAKA